MGRTILVIDDEPELVKLLDYNLTKAGYLVLSAKDGENGWEHRKDFALARVKAVAPDLLGIQEGLPDQVDYFAEQVDALARAKPEAAKYTPGAIL